MGINQDQVTKFTVITGPRGACKTLFMTSLVVDKLIKAYVRKLLHLPERQVWSNYPVGFYWPSPVDHKLVYLQPKPLNIEAFYTFDDELSNGWAYIDEIDQWFDRQDWQSVTQKLLNKGMTQIRKKKLSITCTLQDFNWMNNRGEFQTDTIVKCREAAFTPWGKKQDVELGEVGFLTFRDKSGITTGYAFDELPKEFQLVFQGKRFWGCYDTDYQFNPLESMTKYTIKRPPAKEIVLPGAEGEDVTIGSKGHLSGLQKSEADIRYLSDSIKSVIGDFISMDRDRPKMSEVYEAVGDKTGGLYSRKEIDKELNRIKGIKTNYGTGMAFCKIEVD